MKNKKLILCLTVLFAAITMIFAGCGQKTETDSEKSAKSITVTVVYKDASQKEYNISTDAKFLSDALYEKGLVTKEEYKKDGMYTVIDGVKADYNVDKSWWCVTAGGNMTQVGMDDLEISDGDKYEITYTTN